MEINAAHRSGIAGGDTLLKRFEAIDNPNTANTMNWRLG